MQMGHGEFNSVTVYPIFMVFFLNIYILFLFARVLHKFKLHSWHDFIDLHITFLHQKANIYLIGSRFITSLDYLIQ